MARIFDILKLFPKEIKVKKLLLTFPCCRGLLDLEKSNCFLTVVK